MSMLATVSKKFRFEAAHQLMNHDGKCSDLHGHSYVVEVLCKGPINRIRDHAKEGMVVDFADIKAIWKERVEPKVDHQFLNETLDGIVTTAENIAAWILCEFHSADPRIQVKSVRVWETATSMAEVSYMEVWSDDNLARRNVTTIGTSS